MNTEWEMRTEKIGAEEVEVWSRPIETMDTPIELYPDEVADFPPLVEARAELERLREGIVQHYHDHHDAVFGETDAGFEWDLWRLVGFEQPDPTHLDDVGGDR